MITSDIKNGWQDFISNQLHDENFKKLLYNINKEYENYTVYPPKDYIFNMFKETSFDELKIVIIGQDPYYNHNQANGLAFSVFNDIPLPPSLKNIYKELDNDIGIKNTKGDLSYWANQGILLMNTSLTVRHKSPNSHSSLGYKMFTSNLIEYINAHKTKIIFVLWGNKAQKYESLINDKNYIIKSNHPSPLSCYKGFFGSKPFSKINNILKEEGYKEIDWKIK